MAKSKVALRDRIVELRRVPARELVPHAGNWRQHPPQQRGALQAMLGGVGFAGAVLARQLPDGKLQLIDGHLRADVAGDAPIPVLVTDLTEEEANLVLLTHDPIGSLAETNKAAIAKLVAAIEMPDHADLKHLIAKLEGDQKEMTEQEAKDLDAEFSQDVPGMALKPHEHYDYLVVLASTTFDWNALCDRLGLKPVPVGRTKKIGTCRAIRAEVLLSMLPERHK